MKQNKIVTINGKKYDALTGLPAPKQINNIHSPAQRTREVKARAGSPEIIKKSMLRQPGRNMDIARSKSISRFAPQPSHKPKKVSSNTKPTGKKIMDAAPRKHPLIEKVDKKQPVPKTSPVNKPAKILKEEAIQEALNKAREQEKKERFNLFKKRPKFINAFTIGLFILIIVGYLTYVNMPVLSVRIASAQAGIDAAFPDYYPDGYRVDGPVTYTDGEVIIRFCANTGDSKFVIKQSKSSWDSSAVKNKVDEDSMGEFATREKNGQTIFTYGNNAMWVNGGILYSISGNTRLSTDQILRIATSL